MLADGASVVPALRSTPGATAQSILCCTVHGIPSSCQLSVPSTPQLLAELDGALRGCSRDETRHHSCRSWARMPVADQDVSPLNKRHRIYEYGCQASTITRAIGDAASSSDLPVYAHPRAAPHFRSCSFLTHANCPNPESMKSNVFSSDWRWKCQLQPVVQMQRGATCGTVGGFVSMAANSGRSDSAAHVLGSVSRSGMPCDAPGFLGTCSFQRTARQAGHQDLLLGHLRRHDVELQQQRQQPLLSVQTADSSKQLDLALCRQAVPCLLYGATSCSTACQQQQQTQLLKLQTQNPLWHESSGPYLHNTLKPLNCHMASVGGSPATGISSSQNQTQRWHVRPQEQLVHQQPLTQQPARPQPQQPHQRHPCIPFFMPATPPLDADAPSECILLLCKALCMSECTTARLALHIWNRISGMVRLLLSVRTQAHTYRHSSAMAAAAAANRVYSVAAVWLAAKLEESRRAVPTVHTLAAAARTLPSVLIAAELRVLHWCEWSPYAGFVPDDSHLLIDL